MDVGTTGRWTTNPFVAIDSWKRLSMPPWCLVTYEDVGECVTISTEIHIQGKGTVRSARRRPESARSSAADVSKCMEHCEGESHSDSSIRTRIVERLSDSLACYIKL